MNERVARDLLDLMPGVRREIASALESGADRRLTLAIREAVAKPTQTLWVACREHTQDDLQPGWDLLGVYSSEDLAVARCRIYNHFIAPIELNADLDQLGLIGCRWPVQERSKSQGAIP